MLVALDKLVKTIYLILLVQIKAGYLESFDLVLGRERLQDFGIYGLDMETLYVDQAKFVDTIGILFINKFQK